MDLLWLLLIIPVAYIAISLFFLCFPNIIHKRMRFNYPPFNDLVQTDKLFCIGHRGGGWEGPQNTMQVFKKNESHSHMFEMDVCLTKDKQLVVHHDQSLLRTCGVNKLISDCNYKDLPRFKKIIQSFAGDQLQTTQNKIPLLSEVFQQFPLHPMNIQLKTPSDEAIEEFDRLIRRYKRQDITIWGIVGGMNQNLREINPNTLNFYSAGQVLKVFLLYISGLLPFVCLRQGIIDIPLTSDGFYKLGKGFAGDSCCKQCLVFTIFCLLRFFNFTSGFWIPHLKKRGILTFYWIVNSQDDFDYAISKGCAGIMTDITFRLKNYLISKNLYYEQQNSQVKRL